jgi:hypothetical protein
MFILLILLFLSSSILTAQPLVDPNATLPAKKLKVFLDSIYGKKILSGQAFEGVNETWNTIISEASNGKQPAILSHDFMNSMPWRVSQGTDPAATTRIIIDWVKNKGGIAEMHWHWDAPKHTNFSTWQGFYTKNTTFDLAKALADTTSEEYTLLLRDMDIVAGLLKQMQDSNIAVLWRPLHEAEGTWFWWGAKGGDACKKLWRIMFNRFVTIHQLHNLIWVWNSYGTTKQNWYPGDDVVDIIAWDYPDYSASTGSWKQYQTLFGNRGKLFAIGEDGRLIDPNLLSTQHWLYFITWAYMIQDPSKANGQNTKAWISTVYNDPRVLTLDDLTPGPKAFAGASRTVFDINGDGTETVTLDGSASKTDQGTIVSYVWRLNGNTIAEGVKPEVSLGIGTHVIVLTITTSTQATKTATVTIIVKPVAQSYNKPAKASSSESGSGNVPPLAVDGKESTRWSSAYADPQWIELDLGVRHDISRMVLNWEVASAKNFRIEVSDNQTDWTVVRTLTNRPAGARIDTLKELAAQGRYVRMYGTARNSTWGYSLWEWEVFGTPAPVSNENNTLPEKLSLEQNYPNPFNPETVISFSLPEASHAMLTIHDMAGREVARLVNGTLASGRHEVSFNASHVSSGMYLYRLSSGGQTLTKKMALVK